MNYSFKLKRKGKLRLPERNSIWISEPINRTKGFCGKKYVIKERKHWATKRSDNRQTRMVFFVIGCEQATETNYFKTAKEKGTAEKGN